MQCEYFYNNLKLLSRLRQFPLIELDNSGIVVKFITLVLRRGGLTTPNSFRNSAQKNMQQRGTKIGPGIFKFILSLHFSEKKKIESTTWLGGRVSFQSCNLAIFEVICSPNFVYKLELLFSNIFSKNSKQTNSMRIACFHSFYGKINFSPYFTHKMTICQFSRACSHYDVIVTSYIIEWYLFWYQWKGHPWLYTGSKFRVL